MCAMNKYIPCFIFLIFCGVLACTKSSVQKDPDIIPPGGDTLGLSYGDSILYIKDGEENNVVLPQGNLKGKFYGFPDGIELNELTGAINVDESETGLRYRISYVPEGRTDTLTTIVLLSGINFQDNIYYLDENDTTAAPVYNGRKENSLPGSNSFDEGGGCKIEAVIVNTENGRINIAESIRNGLFGNVPENGSNKEVELLYRVNDNSKKALNKLKVKLYYFDTPDDIKADLVQLMSDRKGMFLGMPSDAPFFQYHAPEQSGLMISSNSVAGTAKPRPPCIFVVGRRSR
jgi:hypothetical protein